MKNKNNDTTGIKATIIDDDQRCIDELKICLADEKDIVVVSEITDPGKAVNEIIKTKSDLLFLDIQMPNIDGFDIINNLKQEGFEPFVIFVTAYDNYAIKAIKTAAFDYLLKPVDKLEMQKSLSRFYKAYSNNKKSSNYNNLLKTLTKNKIKFSTFGGFFVANYEDIIYIQADWNYSNIYTGKDKYETVTQNLGNIEKILPDSYFVRINRSTIINIKYLSRVKRLLKKCILEKDGVIYDFHIPAKRIKELEKSL